MTRARHQVFVWWAGASDAATSPFARVLLGRDPTTGAVAERLTRFPQEETVRAAVAHLAASCPAIVLEEIGAANGSHLPAPADVVDDLDYARFDRHFDLHWVRTSYSALTQAAHDAGPASSAVTEADERVKTDEPDILSPADGLDDPRLGGHSLPLGDVPGGARVGTLVHEILEHADFADIDLPAALRLAAADSGARRLLDDHTDALVAGLAAALATPLGPVLEGRRLCDIRRRDRLDELAFDLPLAGGDSPAGAVTLDAIADVFAEQLTADDPLAGYHHRLRDPVMAAEIRGFLTGSIDLVARVGNRHVVIDYKTNRLAPTGEHLTAWHYRPDALAAAMCDAHYPLQAALYLAALHRYLRWRLPDYDPARHLGGAAYLFLRCMSGPDVPVIDGQPCGTFAWHPPSAFVTRLSDLLDRGTL
jgi:exodeoxyribonuclease V beta subunit